MPNSLPEESRQGSDPASYSISASEESPLVPAEKPRNSQSSLQKARPIPRKRKHGGSNIPKARSCLVDGDETGSAGERPNKKQATAKMNETSGNGHSQKAAVDLEIDGTATRTSAESAVHPSQHSELEVLNVKLAQASNK